VLDTDPEVCRLGTQGLGRFADALWDGRTNEWGDEYTSSGV